MYNILVSVVFYTAKSSAPDLEMPRDCLPADGIVMTCFENSSFNMRRGAVALTFFRSLKRSN